MSVRRAFHIHSCFSHLELTESITRQLQRTPHTLRHYSNFKHALLSVSVNIIHGSSLHPLDDYV